MKWRNSSRVRKNQPKRRSFETMERRELMTANLGFDAAPDVRQPPAVAASSAQAGATASLGQLGSAQYRIVRPTAAQVHNWTFQAQHTGEVSIRVTNADTDLDVEVRNSQGNLIGSGRRSGVTDELITVSVVNPGFYTIRVIPRTTAPTIKYHLEATPHGGADPNDTRGEAMSLGDLSGSTSRNGWIGGSDYSDFYRFRVTQAGPVTVSLRGLTSNADLQVLDSRGRIIGRGYTPGTASESILLDLQPGQDYFIKVIGFSGAQTAYRLAIDTPGASGPAPTFRDANATREGSTNLGDLGGSRTMSGVIGGEDLIDYWKFRALDSGVAVIRGPLGDQIDLRVEDSRGNVVAVGDEPGVLTVQDGVQFDIRAGEEYFVRLGSRGARAGTPYELSISPRTENDNTVATAVNLGAFASTHVGGEVGGSDQADFYRFRPDRSGPVTIQLSGMSRDVDVELLDSRGAVIAAGRNGGARSEWVTASLVAGQEYFIRVFPYGPGASTPYLLDITDSSPPFGAGNSLGDVLGRTATYFNRVGRGDPFDLFRFGVSTGGGVQLQVLRTVEVRLDGLSAAVDLQVVDRSGRVVSTATGEGAAARTLRFDAPNGAEYTIRVIPRGNAVSDYRLSVTAR